MEWLVPFVACYHGRAGVAFTTNITSVFTARVHPLHVFFIFFIFFILLSFDHLCRTWDLINLENIVVTYLLGSCSTAI